MVGMMMPRALQRAAFFFATTGSVFTISFGIYTPYDNNNIENKRGYEELQEYPGVL
jgi:hypothetical protein